tara:strand:+ start:119 stop:637 length:519 start_codon:yes stop_codon:yes gene_type:complete
MSNLGQINLQFRPEEDRLLPLKSSELDEFRFWMTQRFVKGLLRPALINCLATNGAVLGQTKGQHRQAILSFQHERAVSQSNLAKAYEPEVRNTTLGAEPVLVPRANLTVKPPSQAVLGLYPETGPGIGLAVDDATLHSLYRLLSRTVGKAQWDIQLGGGESSPSAASSEEAH